MKNDQHVVFVGPNILMMAWLTVILVWLHVSGLEMTFCGIAVPPLVWMLSPLWAIPLAVLTAYAMVFMVWYAVHAVLIAVGKEK